MTDDSDEIGRSGLLACVNVVTTSLNEQFGDEVVAIALMSTSNRDLPQLCLSRSLSRDQNQQLIEEVVPRLFFINDSVGRASKLSTNEHIFWLEITMVMLVIPDVGHLELCLA